MNCKIPHFDAHCDTLVDVRKDGDLYQNEAEQIDLRRLHDCYTKAVQFFAVCRPMRDLPAEGPFSVLEQNQKTLVRELSLHPEIAVQCRNAAEAKAANEQGKVAAFLTCEGSELLNCDIDKLDWAHEVGLKAINLTWNHENFLCGSNVSAPDRGLNEYGKAFVRKAQSLDILIDVSHCSDPAFFDLAKITRKPFIASHSNARALCDHPRNLTDEMFRVICEVGGVVGINFWGAIVAKDRPSTVHDLVDHIDHFAQLDGGVKHIGIGADWDGCSSMPEGISGVQDEWKLWQALSDRGYREGDLEDIFYNNLMRVI